MDTIRSHLRNVEMPEQVEQALVERIDKDRIDLPVFPQVAGRVMALVSDPSTDAACLSTLIHQDQALAAHVLRIASCPPICPGLRLPLCSNMSSPCSASISYRKSLSRFL